MSDNLRRYRAICHALTQAYPTPPTGHFARHVPTLAALISGIVGGKSTQLPHIATKVPDGSKPESPHLGGDVFLTVCRELIDASRLRDARVGDGWQCRRPWLCGADDPRPL